MTDVVQRKIDMILKRYSKFGITKSDIMRVFDNLSNISDDTKLIAIRLVLADEFDVEDEYFTTEEIAKLYDKSVETIEDLIVKHEDEFLQDGMIVVNAVPPKGE